MAYTRISGDDPGIESFRGAFLKIRRALGTTAFGINEIRLPPGAEGVEHDETASGHEEVYLVLGGGGSFVIDGERVDVGEGDYLRVDAASTRLARAGDGGMRFLVVGGRPQPEYDGKSSL